MNIIQGRTLNEILTVQYGFIPDQETKNTVFVQRRLVECSIEKQNDVYVCHIDYIKAFNTVKHEPCIASPHLFALYTKIIIRSIEERVTSE